MYCAHPISGYSRCQRAPHNKLINGQSILLCRLLLNCIVHLLAGCLFNICHESPVRKRMIEALCACPRHGRAACNIPDYNAHTVWRVHSGDRTIDVSKFLCGCMYLSYNVAWFCPNQPVTAGNGDVGCYPLWKYHRLLCVCLA